MGLLDHRELMIVKGVGKTPGDTSSAEQNPIVVNLMDDAAGFSLESWSPNIPSLKGGGVWADSPISSGRRLVAGKNTNVTETIRLKLVGPTYAIYASRFASLQRMVQAARDFSVTMRQVEPVYLRWWADCAPGPQYALIYNIDLDVEVLDGTAFQAEITLDIEREDGWRGVRPGGNPKEWTYYKLGKLYNNTCAALDTGTDHLLVASIQNRLEYDQVIDPDPFSQNFITVPAASIPGDLEALTEIYCEFSDVGLSVGQLYISRSTKPFLPDTSYPVTGKPSNYILNGADPTTLGTDTTNAADSGAPNSSRARVSFATVTANALRLYWSGFLTAHDFELNLNRGRYLVFTRARLSAAGSVAMTVTLSVSTSGVGNVQYALPTQTLTNVGAGGTGNTTSWPVTYMGVLSVPFTESRLSVKEDGLGAYGVRTTNLEAITLYAQRVSGTPELYVADIVMIPIDECACLITGGDALGNGEAYFFDNTGYFMHGAPGDFSKRDEITNTELRGQGIKLLPGVDNHVHFLAMTNASPPQSEAQGMDMAIKLNIVPRWSGIRDV